MSNNTTEYIYCKGEDIGRGPGAVHTVAVPAGAAPGREEAAAPARYGRRRLAALSTAHKLPLGEARFWVGGSKLRFGGALLPVCDQQVGGGPRGEITGFSRSSRRRLFSKLCEVDKRNSDLPHFITLTFPSVYPGPREAKRMLRALEKRIKRAFPNYACFWKLEPQERGAPHFHLLAWGLDGYDAQLTVFVARNWYQIAGNGDNRHYALHIGALEGSRPCVEKVRTWRGVMAYAAKYLGKLSDESWDAPGRYWGVMFADYIPWATIVAVSISQDECHHLIRYLLRYTGIKRRAYWSLTGFVEKPEYWLDRLDELRDR